MVDAIVTQNAPYALEVTAGEEYQWCSCGRSATMPLCDGAHDGTPFFPLIFVAEKTETIHLCGCLKSKTKPFCDGSHTEP